MRRVHGCGCDQRVCARVLESIELQIYALQSAVYPWLGAPDDGEWVENAACCGLTS